VRPDLPLCELPALAVDVQATGPSPARGHLLELAWGSLHDEGTESSLCALPAGASMPAKVAALTGITEPMLAGAPAPAEAWAALRAAAPAEPLLVVHHARLERAFLTPLAGRELALLDTFEVARRLLPGLPRRGLRPLAGYFGHAVPAPRRAAAHVEATRAIWRGLGELLEERGVRRWGQLARLLQEPPPRAERALPMPRERRLGLPDRPGVYRLLRRDGGVLYVGKATSLKARVNGHFRGRKGGARDRLEMLTQAFDVEVEETETALEAALLESDRIKALSPPHNDRLLPGPVAFVDRRFREPEGPVGPVLDADALLVVGRLARREERFEGPWGPAPEVRERVLAALDLPREVDALLALARTFGVEGDAEDGTPEQALARWIRERLRGALALWRRARWLLRLTDATVSFTEGRRRRRLVLEAGEVVEARWSDVEAAPPGHRRRADGRRACFVDRGPYDRLRILTTELRRLALAGADPSVRLGPHARVAGPALRRLLASV
jgi:DNA polymerase III epsilon subunit-like protein/predicted GIY-YIG superfamily endonuclease